MNTYSELVMKWSKTTVKYSPGGRTGVCLDCLGFVLAFVAELHGDEVALDIHNFFTTGTSRFFKKVFILKEGDILVLNSEFCQHVGIVVKSGTAFMHCIPFNGIVISDLGEERAANFKIQGGLRYDPN